MGLFDDKFGSDKFGESSFGDDNGFPGFVQAVVKADNVLGGNIINGVDSPGKVGRKTVKTDTIPTGTPRNYWADIPAGVAKPIDVTSDTVMQKRVERQSGISGSRFDGMMATLEAQRQHMIARRNAAINAAGRGAGAPYNAAIARIDDELAKLNGQLPLMTDLFEQKIQNQYDIYGRAGEELETSYDEALQYATDISTEEQAGIRAAYSDSQARAADVVENIGGDAATAAAVAEEVGRMEESIINMAEVSNSGIQAIMQAAENLAVKSAIATGATNALELKRKQIQVEADIKDRINDLAEQRKQQVRARNAAVSAARAMAAARWPEGMPMDKTGFMQTSTMNYFRQKNINPEAGAFAADLVDMGMSHNEFRLILNNTRNGKPNPKAEAILGKYGMNSEMWGAIPDEVRSDFGLVANGMEIFTTAGNDYESSFVGADPREFEQNSAARAMAGAEWARQWGHSDQDAFYMGREIAEMPNEKLDYLNDMPFTQQDFTSVSIGQDTFETLKQTDFSEGMKFRGGL